MKGSLFVCFFPEEVRALCLRERGRKTCDWQQMTLIFFSQFVFYPMRCLNCDLSEKE